MWLTSVSEKFQAFLTLPGNDEFCLKTVRKSWVGFIWTSLPQQIDHTLWLLSSSRLIADLNGTYILKSYHWTSATFNSLEAKNHAHFSNLFSLCSKQLTHLIFSITNFLFFKTLRKLKYNLQCVSFKCTIDCYIYTSCIYTFSNYFPL